MSHCSPRGTQAIIPLTRPCAVTFDKPINAATLTGAFKVSGRQTGPAAGTFALEDGGATVVFTPAAPFAHGEAVTVAMSRNLLATDGASLGLKGYAYQFSTVVRPSAMTFTKIDSLTTNKPGEGSRPYGGLPGDFDSDGWIDMVMVNEITGDLSVFLNTSTPATPFDTFLDETFDVDEVPSPSDAGDFNGDGALDICVANTADDSVSIVLNDGDGTFGPQQSLVVGAGPVGIAAFDVDGDGDTDLATSVHNANTVAVARNNGAGVFGNVTSFNAGIDGEYGLAAADMNEDGVLDLLAGALTDGRLRVLIGNGDGTYQQGAQRNVGSIWMLVVADVNADGNMDALTANNSLSTAAVLYGDGLGGIAAPQYINTDSLPVAIDAGDLDGDGDQDLLTSSFGGDWRIYRNSGATFPFSQELDAPQAASCTLALDFDNDGDLDLALVDELAHVVELARNGGVGCVTDLNGDTTVNDSDLGLLLTAFNTCPGDNDYSPLAGGLAGGPCVDDSDLGVLLNQFAAACP